MPRDRPGWRPDNVRARLNSLVDLQAKTHERRNPREKCSRKWRKPPVCESKWRAKGEKASGTLAPLASVNLHNSTDRDQVLDPGCVPVGHPDTTVAGGSPDRFWIV